MINIKKASSNALRIKYIKCIKVQDRTTAFNSFMYEIDRELTRRAHAAIYKAACECVKNAWGNQFTSAARYADAVINGSEWFSTDTTHEIGSYYTKSGHPVIVEW